MASSGERARLRLLLWEHLDALRRAPQPHEKVYHLRLISQLARYLDPSTVQALVAEFASHPYGPLRGEVCYLLGQTGQRGYSEVLRQLAGDSEAWVSEQAQHAATRLKTKRRSDAKSKSGSSEIGLRRRRTQKRVLRVFVGSPSDVVDERSSAAQTILTWNAAIGPFCDVLLQPVTWEIDVPPLQNSDAQRTITNWGLADCDILVAIFWTRIGTPTGRAASGTVEEIDSFLARGRPALLYFSEKPVPPQSIDAAQYRALTSYRKRCQFRGLVQRYSSVGEFREALLVHLALVVRAVIVGRPPLAA